MTISGGYGYLDYFYQNNFDKRVLELEQMFRPVGRAAVVVPGSSGAPAAAGGHWSTSLLSRGAVLCCLMLQAVHTDAILEISAKKGDVGIPLRDSGNTVCWGQSCIRFSASSAKMGFHFCTT